VNSALAKTLTLTPAQSALTKTKDFNPTEICTCKKNFWGWDTSLSGETNSIPFCGKDDQGSARQNRAAPGEIAQPAEIWLTGISS
jgi:hypothetical protein